MIEFAPTPLAFLQERFLRALDHDHTPEDQEAGRVSTPEHVFDFEDGLRLAVYVVATDETRWLLVQAVFTPGSEFDRRLGAALNSLPEANRTGDAWTNLFAYAATSAFQDLAGRRAVELARDEQPIAATLNLIGRLPARSR